MKKVIVTLAVGLTVCAAQADVVLNLGSSGNTQGRVVTLTETVKDTISAVASPFTTNTPLATTGSYSATGAAGTFSITYNGYSDWGDAAGAAALDAGTVETYVAGLNQVNMSFNRNWGVAGYRLDQMAGVPAAGEVAILTFDTSGLTAGYQLSVERFNTWNHADGVTESSIADYYVYNVATDTITDSAVGYNLTVNGSWVQSVNINNGDLLIVKNNINSTDANGFGLSDMTFDVIPEPATLGLVVAFGGGLAFIRRRFMV